MERVRLAERARDVGVTYTIGPPGALFEGRPLEAGAPRLALNSPQSNKIADGPMSTSDDGKDAQRRLYRAQTIGKRKATRR